LAQPDLTTDGSKCSNQMHVLDMNVGPCVNADILILAAAAAAAAALGTITHLAPERFETGSRLTPAVDIYAFGEAHIAYHLPC
jgi:hypothetical protein